jgi:hypothetical protein
MHLSKTARFSVVDLGVGPQAPASKSASKPAAAPKQPQAPAAAAASTGGGDVDALNAAVTKLQSEVKLMKKSGASADALAAKATEMEQLKLKLSTAQAAQGPKEVFPRKGY